MALFSRVSNKLMLPTTMNKLPLTFICRLNEYELRNDDHFAWILRAAL